MWLAQGGGDDDDKSAADGRIRRSQMMRWETEAVHRRRSRRRAQKALLVTITRLTGGDIAEWYLTGELGCPFARDQLPDTDVHHTMKSTFIVRSAGYRSVSPVL